MNPKRFGIVVSIVVIVLALVFIVLGRTIAPDRLAITIGGIAFLALGILYLVITLVMNRGK